MPLYIVRSAKQYTAQPGQSWVNTYEVDCAVVLTPSESQAVMLGIRAAEQNVQLGSVQLFDVTISTYVADSQPYDPTKLYTLNAPIVTGSRSSSSDEESIDTVLYVKKIPVNGKKGKNLYRGSLLDSEVFSEYGKKRLTGPAITSFTTAIGELFLGIQETLGGVGAELVMASSPTTIYYPATPENVKQIPQRISANITYVRPVIGMNLGGVSTLDADFGYYDKA